MARAKRRFVVDGTGLRRSVLLPIAEYQALLEDLAVIAERREEPVEPLEVVRKRLEDRWQNTESKAYGWQAVTAPTA